MPDHTQPTAAAISEAKSGIIPNHVAIIMDGNRRWAKARGLSVIEGHRAGFETLKKIIKHAINLGIRELSFYAFSTENWKRSEGEVEGMMKLARWAYKSQLEFLHKENLRVRVPGFRDDIPKDIAEMIESIIAKTANNTGGTVNICFSYGGRSDILAAVRKLITQGADPITITEESFGQALTTAGMSNVDLVIRTSEYRLSNFLPWESIYAEIYFLPDLYWPDFNEGELDKALAFFASRQRRFGR
ncbi:di-trans,poly-cis-decaprenylcistransferase [Candidatus Microgenomates bacterium]|nr:di-trans,poly-cis-decaprenylcistransferase [Candidatus Microgenomates bacterium]